MASHRRCSTRVRSLPGASALAIAAGLAAGLPASGSEIEQALEHNGVIYPVSKGIENGAEVRRVFFDGRWATEQEWRAAMAALPADSLSPDLRVRLATALPNELLEVVVTLRDQPAAPVSREVFARSAAQRATLVDGIRAITRTVLPVRVMRPDEERAWAPVGLDVAAAAAKRALAQQLDDLDRASRQEIAQRLGAAVRPSQEALGLRIAALGGQVTARVSVRNVLGLRLPAGAMGALAQDPLVARIDLNSPGAPELDNHRISLGLTTGFWANSIDGGVHDVGVLDTGVQQNHPALSSHTFVSNMGVSDTGTHGTGMAGILASTSTQFPGMAFGCDRIVVALAGNDTTSMNGMNFIAGTGEPENVNYSFGNGTANANDYANIDRFFDGVISTFNYMVSKSTGNGGFGSGAPTITHPAPAYNLMASANIYDQNTQPRTDDRIDSSSSRGPTFAGRKKPDIAAPGTNSMSTTPSGGFANIGGTSSASPHTGGGFVLLWDMGATDTMAGKAILLNTTDGMNDNGTSTSADDTFVAGSFWNRRYGWGYINLGQAYLHGLDFFMGNVPPAPENADYRLYAGPMFTDERATLVWERHVTYNGAATPTQVESLSDLDLRAFRETDNALLASSASPIDNVEQLDVDSDEASVVLKVEAFGVFDPDILTEDFALATQEGFGARSGPAFGAGFMHPVSVAPGAQFIVSVEVSNTGDLDAHGVTATISGATVISGPNPASLGSIADADGSGVAQWTVQAPAVAGPFVLSVAIASDSYGETFTGAGQSTVMVGAAPCPGDANGDNVVNFSDLNLVISNFGATGAPGTVPGDVTGDGVVNFADLNLVISNFGNVC